MSLPRISASGPATNSDIVVVAAVVEREGRWLLARRPAGKRHGGCWEMPGGKLHPGETLEDAARRELAEELQVRVTRIGSPVATIRDPGSPYVVHFCPVEIDGEPQAVEHDEVRWMTVEEAATEPLAPTDRSFLASCRLAPSKKAAAEKAGPETPS